MRKNKGKKRTIYTVLFVVVAIMVVGFAILSSTLNIFGGLAVIPGNISWGVKFNNIQVNNESTAGVSVAPTLGSNNTSVNFAITLDQPGKFYEFTVDAVNTGSIDAMIDSLHYNIYDEEDNEIYPQYLYYTVDYANEISLSTGHLLRAGETATYKVRIEFSDDIDMDELPSEEKQLRFEFGVTYIQADDTAYVPGTNSLPEISNVIEADENLADGQWYRINYNHVSIGDSTTKLGSVFEDLSNLPNDNVGFGLRNLVEGKIVKKVTFSYRTINNTFQELSWWMPDCYNNDSYKNELSDIFDDNCSDDGNKFVCEYDSFEFILNSDSSMVATNGDYTCAISSEGESYCY